MEQAHLQDAVLRLVLSELARQGDLRCPVNASNRHIHLCQRDADRLFHPGYRLTPLRLLAQPGQFAAQEQVVMQTDAGSLKLRVVGPIRRETQIELSAAEAVKLRLPAVLRMSGDIQGTPGCRLVNGDKQIALERGVIVAARHVHMSAQEAEAFGLQNGDKVSLLVEGGRGMLLGNVVVRSGQGHALEAHIDREEANACGLRDGQLCRILKDAPTAWAKKVPCAGGADREAPAAAPASAQRAWVGEEQVRAAIAGGQTTIRCPARSIITPLARDLAWEHGIQWLYDHD